MRAIGLCWVMDIGLWKNGKAALSSVKWVLPTTTAISIRPLVAGPNWAGP